MKEEEVVDGNFKAIDTESAQIFDKLVVEIGDLND